MKITSVLLALSVLFTACGTPSVTPVTVRTERGLDAGAIIVGPTIEGHVYAEYGPGADRFPPPRVLFFSGHDPFSEDIDQVLRQMYASGGVTASIFRLQFDTSTGARLQYRVLLPGSIVEITESGALVPIVHPTSESLRQLLLPSTPSLS